MTRPCIIAIALLLASPVAKGEPAPPGKARAALVGAGAGGLAVGTAWFFVAGDSLGAGDPASVMMAVGAVGAMGATLGAVVSSGNETGFDDRAATAPVTVSLGSGGSYYIDEEIPSPATLSLQPRFWFGSRVRLTLGAAAHTTVGSTVDVDWRPQKSFDTALTASHQGLDIDPEIRLYPDADLPLEFAVRPMVHMRWDAYEYMDGGSRMVRRTQIVPVTAGVRWHLSGRQRFENFIGPRWDALAWSTRNGSESAAPLFGPIYLDTRYTYDIPHNKPFLGLNASSRLNAGYIHSNFDGSGFDVVAIIGFMGPFYLDYDLRLRRAPERWGVQFGAQATVGEGGGMAMSIGAVPPLRSGR